MVDKSIYSITSIGSNSDISITVFVVITINDSIVYSQFSQTKESACTDWCIRCVAINRIVKKHTIFKINGSTT